MTRETADASLPFGDLLDRLRRQGFTIGVDHHLRLRTLVARAGPGLAPEDLKTALCPLVATTAEQQEQFYRTFESCFPRLTASEAVAEIPVSSTANPASPGVAKRDRVRRWPYLTGAAAAAVVLVGVLTWKTGYLQKPTVAPPPQAAPVDSGGAQPTAPPRPEQPRPPRLSPASRSRAITVNVQYPPANAPRWLLFVADHRLAAGWAALVTPLMLWLLYEVYRRRSQKLILRKNRGKVPPYTWPIHSESAQASVYDPQELANVSRRLHRRYLGDTERLDVPATVTASIAALGFPTFRYRRDSRLPEYLFLIDRAGFRDHRARLFEHLASALREQGLYVSTYFFEGDPRVCWDTADDEAVHLDQLQRRFPGYRLLMFSEGGQMLDAVSGNPAPWMKQLEPWRERALLTPRPREEWGLAEVTLAQHLLVAPATLDGLELLASYFELPFASSAPGASGNGWERGDGELITVLREFLGPGAFQWLCACAVYPELHWDLTLRLGTLRGMPSGLVSEQNLVKLVRVPWFRNGSIPDDLRRELIGQLDAEVESEVRSSIVEMLEKNPAPPGTFAADAVQFQIAYQKFWTDPGDRKARTQLQRALESMSPEELVQDFAYLETAESATSGPLALLLPRRLMKILFPGGMPWLGPRVGVRLLLLGIAIALGFASLWRSDAAVSAEKEKYRRVLGAGLDFGAVLEGGAVVVRWSPDTAAVRSAAGGLLRIQAERAAQVYALELTPELLTSGTGQFQPRGEKMRVSFRVRDGRGNWVEESVEVVVPQGLTLTIVGDNAAIAGNRRQGREAVVQVQDENEAPVRIGGKVFQAPKATQAQIQDSAPIEVPPQGPATTPAGIGQRVLGAVGIAPPPDAPAAKATAPARGTEQPVGMVLTSTTAQLLRGGTEMPLTARPGDLLFAGDALRARGTTVSWLFCPGMSMESTADAEVAFSASATQAKGGQVARVAVKTCVLPPVRRIAVASQQHYGVSMTRNITPPPPEPVPTNVRNELAAVNAALAANPNDIPALVAAAAVYERYGLNPNAAQQYRTIARLLPDAAWLKAKQFELEERIANAPASNKTPGRTYAVVVGVSQYRRVELSLQFAAADANLVADFLKSPRGGGLAREDIALLTDGAATTAAIRAALGSAQKRITANDTLLIYFAAQGTVENKSNRGFILSHDADLQDLATTALPVSELETLLSSRGRKLLFVDVCRTGTIGRNTINSDISKLENSDNDFLLLTASRSRELAYEGPQFGGGHGAFTYFLIKGLNGEADMDANGTVTPNELTIYVRDRVEEATNRKQHPVEQGYWDESWQLSDLRKPGITIK